MLGKSSIASKHDLLLPLMANSDRPLLIINELHSTFKISSAKYFIRAEHVFICSAQYKAVVKSNKERNLIVYPFQHDDDDGQDEEEDNGQTES